MILLGQILIVALALYVLYMSAFVLKRLPRGLLEWLVWIAAVGIIVSWVITALG